MLFGLSLILSSSVNPDHIPTVVCNHRWIPLSLISFLHSCNVLVESFPMLISYFSTVQWKEILKGMQKVNLHWHIAAKGFAGLQEVCQQLLMIICFVVSKKLCCYWWKSFPCCLFFSMQQMIKSIISKKFADLWSLWSHKDPFLPFCFTKS